MQVCLARTLGSTAILFFVQPRQHRQRLILPPITERVEAPCNAAVPSK
jgi:hypothetical protein